VVESVCERECECESMFIVLCALEILECVYT